MKEQEYLEHKVCKRCKEEKTVSEFYTSNRGYYDSYCKPCCSFRTMDWRRRHPEQQAAIQAKIPR